MFGPLSPSTLRNNVTVTLVVLCHGFAELHTFGCPVLRWRTRIRSSLLDVKLYSKKYLIKRQLTRK